MTENIIFLGAGASAAEGAPAQTDLLGCYFRTVAKEPDLRLPLATMNQELAIFFQQMFGVDTGTCDATTVFPTFEEALGFVELALQRGEQFRGFGDQPNLPQLQRIRKHLSQTIAFTLDRTLKDAGKLHRALVESLAAAGELRQTAFVSTNYDILIDNAVAGWQERAGMVGQVNYAVSFSNYTHSQYLPEGFRWPVPDPSRAVLLLKPHGSLNWLYCATCTALTLTPSIKGATSVAVDPERYRCPVCTGLTTPIIVPPTFFKAMSNFHLQQVWRAAEACLMEARRLVFCGYSLADADIHVKYLLKRIEVNRNYTPEVIIINNYRESGGSAKSEKSKAEERARYLRLFRDPRKVRYTDLTFQEFSSRGFAAL